jgi:ubiquinone/menaquinone biosynthesis C-methylase UbiE
MQRSPRVDYDSIADWYDSQPYREKSVDPALAAFIAGCAPADTLSLLDIACGTGSQLIANRAIAPHARMVGIDGSFGMLRRARCKSRHIAWVQADGAALPFQPESFDFVSCQYAFHHLHDKAEMLRGAWRVLRSGGRLTIYNLCPRECEDWLYYRYFPEALARDLADFWPTDAIVAAMETAGFASVLIEHQHLRFEHDLAALLDGVRRRDTNSQLMAISDAAYRDGLRRIERDLGAAGARRGRADHLCFATVRGDKPVTIACSIEREENHDPGGAVSRIAAARRDGGGARRL